MPSVVRSFRSQEEVLFLRRRCGRYTAAVERPKTTSMMLAGTWVAHVTNEAAWDEMREVVDDDRERAWRLILAMVGCAPDYDVLATVAAGPVEDLIDRHGDWAMPMIAGEARNNVRLRICLGAAYSELPADVSALVEGETTDVRDLAVDSELIVTGEDLALVMAWLHHSDTAWSSEFLKEMTENDPAAAWDVLRVLVAFADEDTRIRHDVFEDALHPFMRRHFTAYREHLIGLGRKSAAFREWTRDQKRPVTDDAATWAAFVADLTSG
jgi:hypothetical protein